MTWDELARFEEYLAQKDALRNAELDRLKSRHNAELKELMESWRRRDQEDEQWKREFCLQ